MRLYSFLLVVTTVESAGKYCDIVTNDPVKQCYVKETLTTIPHSPNQLSVDKTTNMLYFSFDFGQGAYVPAILNIQNKTLSVLKGVKDAFAIANDNVTGDMYFGGSQGIYMYQAKKQNLLRLNMNNLDIWWLFIKKNIYLIKFPSLNAYYYENKLIKPVPELKDKVIHQFVFDKEDNIYFLNATGLFGVKQGDDRAILLRDNPKFLGIATDNNGYVHACSEDGIFVVKKLIQKVTKVFDIQGVLGITFDSSNYLIYSTSHEIVRLVSVNGNNNNVGY